MSNIYHFEAIIDFHLSAYRNINPNMNKLVIQKIKDPLYAEGVKEGQMLHHDSKRVFSNAGVNLRKWNSNSKILKDYINNFKRKNGEDSKIETSYANEFLNSVQVI